MRLPLCALLMLAAACRPPGYGKGGGDDEPSADAPAVPGDDAGRDAPRDVAEAMPCTRQFRLEGRGSATTVYLTGDFIGWGANPGAGAMPLVLGADTAWTGAREFPPGSYLYKFIVNDSDWIHDESNPERVDDGFGGFNSVYTCAP